MLPPTGLEVGVKTTHELGRNDHFIRVVPAAGSLSLSRTLSPLNQIIVPRVKARRNREVLGTTLTILDVCIESGKSPLYIVLCDVSTANIAVDRHSLA